MFSMTKLLLVLGGVLLLFGGRQLPRLGSAVGEGIRNARKGLRAMHERDDDQ
jgi:TatA/E family protein of Tat protein translocase